MSVALPLHSCTVIVFALAPAVRFTRSMLARVSVPSPVSVVEASVKSTSADSVTVSVPMPPSKLSFPAEPMKESSPFRPMSVSAPARPESTLSLVFPRTVSANAVPVTFSIPVTEESFSVKPDTSVCAVATARSRFTPPFWSPVKSSVSVSALAPSTIVTLAESIPRKT